MEEKKARGSSSPVFFEKSFDENIVGIWTERNWFVYVGMVFDGILMETESSSSPDCITGFVLFCSTTREPVTQILFINIIICLSMCRLSVSFLTMFYCIHTNLRLYQY